MKDSLIRKRKMAIALLGAFTLSLASCGKQELGSDNSNIDMLNPNFDNSDDNLVVKQELGVENESFKLNIEYSTEEGSTWRITDTKHLFMTIHTKDLEENKEVYIDNIHTDTYIVSSKAIFDGILQDTMDDRIHNSLMLGFPISNSNTYFGCNTIEGQNQEFLEGFTYGYNGYLKGETVTKRRLESDFLENGVYANKIVSVIDLIVVDKNTQEYRTVSVYSELLVKVDNRVTYLEKGNYVTYEYDIDGNKKKIDTSSIDHEIEELADIGGTYEPYYLTLKNKTM